jgi:hypothetical protein
MKRSQETMSLVRWMFDEAGLVAESMALTSGGDGVAEDEDGGWCVGNNRGRYGRNEEKPNGDFNKSMERKKPRSRMPGKDDASSGEKMHNTIIIHVQTGHYLGINGAGSPLSGQGLN